MRRALETGGHVWEDRVHHRNNRTGVTLIEVAVVVTLIGILVGITYPSVAGAMTKASARSAQTSVANYLARARSVAVQRGLPTRMILSGNTITVAVDSAGTLRNVGAPVDLRVVYGTTVTTSRSVIELDARGFAVGLTEAVEFSLTNGSGVSHVCVRRLGNIVPKRCSA